ncbi:MAG: short-chain dehydrogenase [Acidimicrobiia bacterium]|nr:MAG: short-chain dehydrogenase [Acidimicrobiia bacterium]
MTPTDKTVVVTGGANGIGRQVVLEAIRRGARVAAVDIRPDDLAETERLAEDRARIATFVCDVTDRDAVAALPAQITERLGPADMVIHVAGIIQPFVKLADLDYPTIDRVVRVNLYGTIHVVKAFLPHLLDRPEGWVAAVSSMGGYLPVPGQAVYGATKAAVKLLTEALYAELLDTPVGVSVIMPGAVATEITAHSGVEAPRVEGRRTPRTTSPEEAARIIWDGIRARRLHIYVGSDAKLMGRLQRLAPRRSIHLIQRQMRDLLG